MNNDIFVYAFSGCARVGKTTAAKYMQNKIALTGVSTHVLSFADPIKNAIREIGVTKETHPGLYRKLAQFIGTDAVRTEYPDWWVDHMFNRIQTIQHESDGYPTTIIIDDVRFPNEMNLVKRFQFGYNVFVYGGEGRIDLSLPVYAHESETMGVGFERNYRDIRSKKLNRESIPEIDLIIDNSMSMMSLDLSIDQILQITHRKAVDKVYG